MKNSIWKFTLVIEDEQVISVPIRSKPLTVQMQNGVPVLWVLVYPEIEHMKDLKIITHGTGHTFPDEDITYIGTYQNGGFVGHVFIKE